jgi:signal transduction histidine kinase
MRRFVPFGDGAEVVARQAAALFALAGLLAVLGAAGQPARAGTLAGIAVADLAVTLATWQVPWARLPEIAPLGLCLPAFAILAASTWAFGGVATGTGPFFVLLFAWAGLHFPPWSQLAMAPPALLAYLLPLVLSRQPKEVVSSGIVLIPICVGVGLVICQQAVHQRRARDQVRQVEQWRAALMATLAHDVRSPLTSVQLALECLRDDRALPPQGRDRLLGAALRQTSRISRLAAGLLDLDRIETLGTLRLDLTDVPLRTAVDEALADLSSGDVIVQVPAELTIMADPQRVEQMVVNLVGNALHHGRPPVVVRAEADGNSVRISVRDHGAGVPDLRRGALFDRFGPTSPDRASVGLGLWIVRELAGAHGGHVEYAPAMPGAVFTVVLPLVPEPAAATALSRS